MTDDISGDKKKVLEYFKVNEIKVHIKVIDGDDKGLFRNGIILATSDKHFLILDEMVGSCNYFYDEISDKIVKFREDGE